jgi:hypothetical protein
MKRPSSKRRLAIDEMVFCGSIKHAEHEGNISTSAKIKVIQDFSLPAQDTACVPQTHVFEPRRNKNVERCYGIDNVAVCRTVGMTRVLTFHVVVLFTGQVYRTVAVRLVCRKSWSSGCDRLIPCYANRAPTFDAASAPSNA